MQGEDESKKIDYATTDSFVLLHCRKRSCRREKCESSRLTGCWMPKVRACGIGCRSTVEKCKQATARFHEIDARLAMPMTSLLSLAD